MENNKNVPAIRFKGFNDAWEQCDLKELLTQRVEHQTISEKYPLLAFSYAEGIIDPKDKKTNKRDFIMTDKYNKIFSKVEIDDIVYNPANVIHGAIHRNKFGRGVVSPIYKIFICKNVNSKFLGERLHNKNFIHEIVKYIEGTVVKLRTLSPKNFLDMSIELPRSMGEQKKIGVFLELIEESISLHKCKLIMLENVKKSMLEKLFPTNGSCCPQIRFVGFNEDWEQRTLEDCSSYRRGSFPQPYGKKEWYDGKDSMPFVQVVDVTDNLTLEENTKQKISKLAQSMSVFVPKGSVIVTLQGSIGRVAITQYDAFFDRTILIFDDTKNYNINSIFWSFIIQNKFDEEKEKAPGGTIKTITKEALSKFIVMIPKITEQERIGHLLLKLNNSITLHQRKLEMLENIKKSMLNKMFVA